MLRTGDTEPDAWNKFFSLCILLFCTITLIKKTGCDCFFFEHCSPLRLFPMSRTARTDKRHSRQG